jgi:hypothetical protein
MTFVCCYVLICADGGEPEVRELHRGNHESCEKVSNLLSAISYSGDRTVSSARMMIVPASVFDGEDEE